MTRALRLPAGVVITSCVRPPMKQTSASRTENWKPRSLMPAQTRSGRGLDSGLGLDWQSFIVKYWPWKSTLSSDHSRLTIVVHSSVRA